MSTRHIFAYALLLLAGVTFIIAAAQVGLIGSSKSFSHEAAAEQDAIAPPEDGNIWPIESVTVIGENAITVTFAVHERAARCQTFESVATESSDAVVITVVSHEIDPDDESCRAPDDGLTVEDASVQRMSTVETNTPVGARQIKDGYEIYLENSGQTTQDLR